MSRFRSNFEEQTTPRLQWLSDSQLEELHSATIEILERVGTRVDHPEALEMLRDAGCLVKDKVVRIPGWLVEECIQQAPKRVTLANRRRERCLYLEKNRSYFGPGSDLPYTIDMDTGERRSVVKEDIEQAVKLADFLPNLDFVMSYGIPTDVPVEENELHQFEAMLTNSIKPIVFTALSHENTAKIVEMAAVAVGGLDKLKERPLMALYTEPLSPLVHTYDGVAKMFTCIDNGVPVIYTPGVVAGGTTPVTKAGTIVQMNAESLAGLVMAQVKQRGASVIIGGGATPMDMMTSATLYGAPDTQMNFCAMTELSRFYEVPNFTEAGCCNAPVPDAQAGMEASMGILLSQLSGANLIHDVGYLDGGKTGTLPFLVMCDEFIDAARHIGSGTRINENTLAVEQIEKIGPAGQFISTVHTAKNFRNEIWLSKISNRDMWDNWEKQGKKDLHEKAKEKTREILLSHEPEPLSATAREEISRIVTSGRT